MNDEDEYYDELDDEPGVLAKLLVFAALTAFSAACWVLLAFCVILALRGVAALFAA